MAQGAGEALETSIGGLAAAAARARIAAKSARWPARALPILLVAMALALTAPRIDIPQTYVFDELYYAYTASKYVAGDDDAYRCCRPPRERPAIEWTHPPVAKLLIAGGIALFGDTPLGWRVASVLFGAAGVTITFFLAKALSGDRAIAGVASGLLLLDGLYLVESRTGMSNLFLLVFTNAALLAFAHVLTTRPERASRPLLATGVLLGLAVATKWSAVALLGPIALAFIWHGWRTLGGSPAALSAYVMRGVTSLVLVPALVYLLTYAHFFLTGHGWSELISLHRSMFDYHRELGVVHDYSSSWWEWPLTARPVWYYGEPVGEESGRFVFANGNPLLYWPMVVAVGWVLIDWWGRRPAAVAVLAIGFFGQWLPWAFSPRGTFIYHFLPAAPLGCIALAVVIGGAWRHGGWQRAASVAYMVAAIAVFVYFYPLYVAMPLTPDQVAARMWFGSWR
jgi:dolichyl-phosphate-mannose--protein O-mannosyl transferase